MDNLCKQYIPESPWNFLETLKSCNNITLFPEVVNACMFLKKTDPSTTQVYSFKMKDYWWDAKAVCSFTLCRVTKAQDDYKWNLNIAIKTKFSAN